MSKKYIYNYFLVIILFIFSLFTIAEKEMYSQDNSVSGQLTVLEMQVYNQSYDNEPVIERLVRLEKDTFGAEKTGAIFNRLDALNRELKSHAAGSNQAQHGPPVANTQQQQNYGNYQQQPPQNYNQQMPPQNYNQQMPPQNYNQQPYQRSYQGPPPPINNYPQGSPSGTGNLPPVTQPNQNYSYNNYQSAPPPANYNNAPPIQPPANTYQPAPPVPGNYHQPQTSKNNDKNYDIPGLKSRFEPGTEAKDNLPTREEIKKIKEDIKQKKENGVADQTQEDNTEASKNDDSTKLEPLKTEEQEQQEESNTKGKKKKKKKKNKQKAQEEEPEFDPNTPSYFDTLMYVNKDQVIRWKKMPLKIFIPAGNNITYRPEYRKAAIRALNLWKVKTDGVIDYVLVDNPKKTDIIVIWQENFPEAEDKTGETTTKTGYNLNQAMTGNIISSTSMFMPGYYGYGASLLGYLVGGLGNRKKIRDVKMRIGTLPAMKLDKDKAVNVIESITSHEFGHAIGVTCHSVNPEDIMFHKLPFNGQYAKTPTTRDVNTVIELYNSTPDVTD